MRKQLFNAFCPQEEGNLVGLIDILEGTERPSEIRSIVYEWCKRHCMCGFSMTSHGAHLMAEADALSFNLAKQYAMLKDSPWIVRYDTGTNESKMLFSFENCAYDDALHIIEQHGINLKNIKLVSKDTINKMRKECEQSASWWVLTDMELTTGMFL